MVEMLEAKKYYGPHATGWVVLVNGYPYFHGGKREAQEFASRATHRAHDTPDPRRVSSVDPRQGVC